MDSGALPGQSLPKAPHLPESPVPQPGRASPPPSPTGGSQPPDRAVTMGFSPSATPYGVFSCADRPRLGLGLGPDIIDIDAAARAGQITSIDPALLTTGRLDDLLQAGAPVWKVLREELSALIEKGSFTTAPIPQADAAMHLAWEVADYVDFYSSRFHAENVGRMFRPNQDPLPPNWLHLPVGYHGRSGTVVVDGAPVRRPAGQYRTPDGKVVFGPSQRLDFELEVGFVLGGESVPGEPIPLSAVEDHLFGVVLVNDWSARDLQAWENVPLGPFLGKSFATSVSAWVVPWDALSEARVPGPAQIDPRPLPYLRTEEPWGLSLDLEIRLRPAGATTDECVAAVNTSEVLYWNVAQQVTHMTANGATVRPGDLIASGTVSGPERHQRGSLLELSWNGADPLDVGGRRRTFLEDGDRVALTGSAPGPHGPIPLGPVCGEVIPHETIP